MLRSLLLLGALVALAHSQQQQDGVVSANNGDGRLAGDVNPVLAPFLSHPDENTSGNNNNGASSSSSSQVDLIAIFSACTTDMFAVCQGKSAESCLQNLRLNWAVLGDKCRTALVDHLPCVEDAVRHCQETHSGPGLVSCLLSVRSSDLLPSCVSWLQERRGGGWLNGWTNGAGDAAAIDNNTDDNNNNGNTAAGGDASTVPGSWLSQTDNNRGYYGYNLTLLLLLIALISCGTGAFCALCCVRICRDDPEHPHRRRHFYNGYGFYPQGANNHHGKTVPVIPIEHLPANGPLGYAVMADDAAAVVPV